MKKVKLKNHHNNTVEAKTKRKTGEVGATMIYRKSSSAETFFHEMFRWIKKLDISSVKPYVQTILRDLKSHEQDPQFTLERAETYLMYSIILQNYTLHIK